MYISRLLLSSLKQQEKCPTNETSKFQHCKPSMVQLWFHPFGILVGWFLLSARRCTCHCRWDLASSWGQTFLRLILQPDETFWLVQQHTLHGEVSATCRKRNHSWCVQPCGYEGQGLFLSVHRWLLCSTSQWKRTQDLPPALSLVATTSFALWPWLPSQTLLGILGLVHALTPIHRQMPLWKSKPLMNMIHDDIESSKKS